MPTIKVAMETNNITGRESKVTKLMEKNVTGNDVRSTTLVKINRINLALSANRGHNTIKVGKAVPLHAMEAFGGEEV
jgi:hypothetical protein